MTDHLSRLGARLEDGIQLKLTNYIPVFEVETDIASKTPKQEENETDYYPHDEVDENIR